MADATLHPEEYAVLSAVLRHGLPADTRRIVIESATTCDRDTLSALQKDPVASAARLEVSPELISDFALINANAATVLPQLDITAEYTLLNRSELDALFATSGWQGFFNRYAATPGVIRLSRVGFDPATQHALVLVEQLCGTECGAGRMVHLQRDAGGAWQVLGTEIVWLAIREAAGDDRRTEP